LALIAGIGWFWGNQGFIIIGTFCLVPVTKANEQQDNKSAMQWCLISVVSLQNANIIAGLAVESLPVINFAASYNQMRSSTLGILIEWHRAL
jgi:hypothetical protein